MTDRLSASSPAEADPALQGWDECHPCMEGSHGACCTPSCACLLSNHGGYVEALEVERDQARAAEADPQRAREVMAEIIVAYLLPGDPVHPHELAGQLLHGLSEAGLLGRSGGLEPPTSGALGASGASSPDPTRRSHPLSYERTPDTLLPRRGAAEADYRQALEDARVRFKRLAESHHSTAATITAASEGERRARAVLARHPGDTP